MRIVVKVGTSTLAYPTGRLNKTKKTISIHWYSKSWMDRSTILRSKLTKPLHRIFGIDFFRKMYKGANKP